MSAEAELMHIKVFQLVTPDFLRRNTPPVLSESPILASDILLNTELGYRYHVEDPTSDPVFLYARRFQTFAPDGKMIAMDTEVVPEGKTHEEVLARFGGTGWAAEVEPLGKSNTITEDLAGGIMTTYAEGVQLKQVMCVRVIQPFENEVLDRGILIRSEKHPEVLLPIREDQVDAVKSERVYGRFRVYLGTLYFAPIATHP